MSAAPKSPEPSGALRVSLEDGLIHHDYEGDQTAATVHAATLATDKVVERLQAKQQPVLILSDFTNIGDQTQGARDEMRDALGTRYFDRIAAFGVPPRLQVVGRLLLTLSGKGDRVKIFDTKEQAEDWLREFIRNQ